MWKRLLILVTVVASSVACFEIQGKHTLYLSPDGTVTWTVLEEEIRLGADTPEKKRLNEEDFAKRVAEREHETARSLEALHPGSLDARILREEAPQSILTEARFPAIDLLYRNLFDLYGMRADTDFTRREGFDRFVVEFWIENDEESGDDPDAEDEIASYSDEILLALLLDCRIVLTEGRFVEAVGFEILDDGKAVKPLEIDDEDAKEHRRPVTLSLTWTAGDQATDVTAEEGPHAIADTSTWVD